MKRSSAFCFLTLALLAVLGSAFAQQPGRIPAVGVLITHAPLTDPVVESIRSGFRALGYEEGAKASELPVEQVAKFQLAVNLRTAKALGITVSQSVLSRAEEVIR